MARIPVEHKRRGIPWWAWLLIVLAIAALLWMIFRILDDDEPGDDLVLLTPGASATADPAVGTAGAATTSTADALGVAATATAASDQPAVAATTTAASDQPAAAEQPAAAGAPDRFQQFWEQNGGLEIFGYPLTEPLEQGGRTVQYFERARLELHPENPPPYQVIPGRVGAEVMEARGIPWQSQAVSSGPVAGCLYFPETQHNVCNQQPGTGFLNYWSTHGVEFDGQAGASYAESLALFGKPLSEPYLYATASGEVVQIQWFERARFEWRPGNPPETQVMLGRLGAELPAQQPAQ